MNNMIKIRLNRFLIIKSYNFKPKIIIIINQIKKKIWLQVYF